MKFEKQLSSLMTAALLCGTFTTLSSGQQTAAASGAAVSAARLRPPVPSTRLRMQLWLSRLLLSPRTPCAPATSAS